MWWLFRFDLLLPGVFGASHLAPRGGWWLSVGLVLGAVSLRLPSQPSSVGAGAPFRFCQGRRPRALHGVVRAWVSGFVVGVFRPACRLPAVVVRRFAPRLVSLCGGRGLRVLLGVVGGWTSMGTLCVFLRSLAASTPSRSVLARLSGCLCLPAEPPGLPWCLCVASGQSPAAAGVVGGWLGVGSLWELFRFACRIRSSRFGAGTPSGFSGASTVWWWLGRRGSLGESLL